MTSPFHAPLFALAALMGAIWLLAVVQRVQEIAARRIHPQALINAQTTASMLKNGAAMDNFNNLMEMPLLFGLLCLLLAQLQVQSAALLVGAWLYVGLRVVHSLIQVSYKRVMHRFPVWVASCVVLWGMWLGAGWVVWG
jgi:hypothetical protein